MKAKLLGLGMVAGCLLGAPAISQEPQVQQQQQQQKPQKSILDEQVEDFFMPIGSEELGVQRILRRIRRQPWIYLTSASDFVFTSNVKLEDKNPGDDLLFVQSLDVTVVPPTIKAARVALFYRHQFFRYVDHYDLNFDADSIGLNASWPLGKHWTVFAGYSGLWLQSHSADHRPGDNEFYKEGDLLAGASFIKAIHPRIAIYTGGQIDFHHASPADYTRLTGTVFGGARFAIINKLVAELSHRFQYEDHLHRFQNASENISSRTDFRNNISASLTYYIRDWANVRLSASQIWNNSDAANHDYNVFNGGATLTLSYKF